MSTDKNEEEKLREALERFEEGFPDAVYAVPHEPREPRIKVYKLYQYCRKHSKRPDQLTCKEKEQFYHYD